MHESNSLYPSSIAGMLVPRAGGNAEAYVGVVVLVLAVIAVCAAAFNPARLKATAPKPAAAIGKQTATRRVTRITFSLEQVHSAYCFAAH